jgi:hypothetical protein
MAVLNPLAKSTTYIHAVAGASVLSEPYVGALDRAASAGKPVAVLKQRARHAIMSHTGGLAGEACIFSEVFKPHRAALSTLIYAVANYAYYDRDDISEIDLNPVTVIPEGQGCVVVDALIIRAYQ